jgi:hypothetical protein
MASYKYYVEEGKALACRKGLLEEHTVVEPEYIGGDDDEKEMRLNELEVKGLVYKGQTSKPEAEANRKAALEKEQVKKAAETKRKASEKNDVKPKDDEAKAAGGAQRKDAK